MEKIDVIFKICNRNYDISPYLKFWIDQFSNDRYNLIILNDSDEDFSHPACSTINTKDIPIEIIDNCNELLENSRIHPEWYKAGMSHLLAFSVAQSNYFWNIDADDMLMKQPLKDKELQAIQNHAIKNGLFSTSWDLYQSYVDHWAFGFNFSKNDFTTIKNILIHDKEIAKKFSLKEFIIPSLSLDHILGFHKKKFKVECFMTNNTLLHKKGPGHRHYSLRNGMVKVQDDFKGGFYTNNSPDKYTVVFGEKFPRTSVSLQRKMRVFTISILKIAGIIGGKIRKLQK